MSKPKLASQGGYVLLTVLATLALVAFMAARFAQRIDALRSQTGFLQAQAKGQITAASAKAAAFFWLATQPAGPNGFGNGTDAHWPADGRWIEPDVGGAVRLQDQRGLLSLNVLDREPMARLLIEAGVSARSVPRLLDTLEDYTDTDSLRRLNGAERAQYVDAGLIGPRNDWLSSTRELCQMPAWMDDVTLCRRIDGWVSTRRGAEFNPNTAPAAVLRANMPGSLPGQIEKFVAQRRSRPFNSTADAEAKSGLGFQRLDSIFWVGNALSLTVWAPGLPRATEYNLLMLPDGLYAPWLVTESHHVDRPASADLGKEALAIAQPYSAAASSPIAPIQSSNAAFEVGAGSK